MPLGTAPGFRDAGDRGLLGALGYDGYGGYSWSSAVSGTGGMDLNFIVTWLNPSHTSNRGYGFQLRCLSE